jgi:hypothetical protein
MHPALMPTPMGRPQPHAAVTEKQASKARETRFRRWHGRSDDLRRMGVGVGMSYGVSPSYDGRSHQEEAWQHVATPSKGSAVGIPVRQALGTASTVEIRGEDTGAVGTGYGR